MFGNSSVFLEICSTYSELQCHKCLFHMNNHKHMIRTVTFVGEKNYKIKYNMNFFLQTKHNIFFSFKSEISRFPTYIKKIQKFLRMSWAPIITNNGIHFLITGLFDWELPKWKNLRPKRAGCPHHLGEGTVESSSQRMAPTWRDSRPSCRYTRPSCLRPMLQDVGK